MIVIRHGTSQDAMKGQEAKKEDNTLVLDRVVYRRLGSLTQNKVIQNPTGVNLNEWERFLLDMEDIHNGIPVDPSVDALDEYLGLLGITEEFPFPQDTYSLAQWIEFAEPARFRNVSTKTGDNVIANINGVDTNVIHNTEQLITGVINGRK